ncbi:MAG: polyribonucleotide nucleotidyltransferase [Alphaproteobacteria bacterium]|nr:MAG: polyribonucleotide nucleotidyltransferase [Alphaproteobacteria bacterium]
MFKENCVSLTWGDSALKIETGKVARQADGSVMVTYGETVVLAAAVVMKEASPEANFFPLTVHYQEKTYAAGKVPGGFLKRESRPSEKEVLTSRLIDRPIRPLFPQGFYNEVQLICTVMSYDETHDPVIAAMIAASAALAISGAPFLGPIGAARVAYKDGQFLLNPPESLLPECDLDLVVAGTEEGVLMVESEARELTEEQMLEAVVFGQKSYEPVIAAIKELAKKASKPPIVAAPTPTGLTKVEEYVRNNHLKEIDAAYEVSDKQKRYGILDGIKQAIKNHFSDDGDVGSNHISFGLDNVKSAVLRNKVLDTKKRIDGRDLVTVRPIVPEVSVLPRTHGSCVFTRGETQAFVVATLGTGQDEQMMDTLSGMYKEKFLLHYNFPSYSVGEAGRVGPPGRREIGHGKLAWRAIRPVLPSGDAFPYTIRVVSEITESNGSSSMATVCGTSLALMDAGVKISAPVAGIAMGLIKENDRIAVLTDILGDEDHLGDMDFKVAGTEKGITALQMDIKITSITSAIMKQALTQAKDGRIHILGEMTKALSVARDDLNPRAPRILRVQIPKDKIGEVIGPGGSNIRKICETTGATVDIEEDGSARVGSADLAGAEAAVSMIKMTFAEPEIGQTYDGKVVSVVDFGAFINFFGPKDGLVHISEICDERLEKVSERLNLNDLVRVKVVSMEKGRVKLTMKGVDQPKG